MRLLSAGRDGGTGRRSGLKIRRASARGGSTPPPGTILNTNIICEIKGLPRSLGLCVLDVFRSILHYGTNSDTVRITVFSITWIRLQRTLFLLVSAIYARLRNAQRTWSDHVLAVARVFTALFLEATVPCPSSVFRYRPRTKL
jgi:hypothetical protein